MHAHACAHRRASFPLVLTTIVALVAALAGPLPAFGVREGETQWIPQDANGNGVTDAWAVDFDGDGLTDEVWVDSDEDGTVDEVIVIGGSSSHSPRGIAGKTRVTPIPISTGGDAAGIDWDGDGKYDEYWWDFDADGTVEDVDVKHTESKVLDNTRSTRFRGVLVGVNNGLEWAEQDIKDVKKALENHPDSWTPGDATSLTGAAATPAAIQNAINAAKGSAKPGDEFLFYFSGHGGGYHKKDGYKGGIIDADGDETAIIIRERDFRADGSKIETPTVPGTYNGHVWDTNGDGKGDRAVTKDASGTVEVRTFDPGPPPTVGAVLGTDADGDGDVDGDDGGVDINNDGDKDDSFAVDDTLLVASGAKITDDQLVTWLSGFPESCTIVVILDSCFSGSFVPDLKRVKDKEGKPLRPGHLEAITASTADGYAYEEPISNGVLTQAILNALAVVDADGAPGGHTTSLADKLSGSPDDITTTAELFSFAGPQATTYHVGDEDGDGLIDEDRFTHEFETLEIDPVAGSDPGLSGIIHGIEDPDGDGPDNIDLQPTVASFFDEWFGPPPDMLGTMPRFRQTLGGDTALSLTGMLPGLGMYSDMPFLPGAPTAVEIDVAQMPATGTPDPPAGLSYASECYDLSVWLVNVMPPLDEEDFTGAMLDRLPLPAGWSPTRVRIDLGEWALPLAPGVMPFWYNDATDEWEPTGPFFYEPVERFVELELMHTSMFALFYPGPGPGTHGYTTIAPPTRLTATRQGADAQLAWSNPTDPYFVQTRVFRSTSGYATDGSGSGVGQTLVYQGSGWNAADTGVEFGRTYYYTAFSQSAFGYYSATGAQVRLDMASVETPVQGSNRYTTAVEASRESFPNGLAHEDAEGRLSVVVATGANWPDALGGASLAGAAHGPILLTAPTSLPADVAAEIDRLGADRVFVVGGTSAVSEGVANALLARPGVTSVERVSGANRYATAEAVAERTVDLLDGRFDGTFFVATGSNFPDALAASPIAASKGWPLYLCGPTTLGAGTVASIARISGTDAIILGGTSVVPASVESYLDGELDGVVRLAGTNRYRTAIAVAEHGATNVGLSWAGMGLATGQNYPDALSGGVLVGQRGAVMLLTESAALNAAARATITTHRADIAEVLYLGGPSALSQNVRNAVGAILY